jgi:hypothetical protein
MALIIMLKFVSWFCRRPLRRITYSTTEAHYEIRRLSRCNSYRTEPQCCGPDMVAVAGTTCIAL